MGFFTSAPKRVTQAEMKIIMHNLHRKLDKQELIEVEKLFRADLYEPGLQAGVSQSEFDAAMKWLDENPSKHVLEDDDIELIRKYFTEHLKD